MDNPIIIGIVFVCTLILLGAIIGIIIFVFPQTKLKLHNKCFNQSDCSTGLVCSTVENGPSVCLSGLEQPCQTNTDCAFSLACITGQYVCGIPVKITENKTSLTLMPSTIFNSNLTFGSGINTKMKPITSINQLM